MTMVMTSCPECYNSSLKFIEGTEEVLIHEEPVIVPVKYYKCQSCDIEFNDPDSTYDPVAYAYQEYRKRHNMMGPEEIRDIRKKYGVSQKELAKLLGWGDATISRYENGALQDDAHNTMLTLIKEPNSFFDLVRLKGDCLSNDRKEHILLSLEKWLDKKASFLSHYYEKRSNSSPAIENGYRKLNIEKLLNTILFFCTKGVHKTKLNKLLFYTDFKQFKEYAVSITGATYIHLPYGPVLDQYNCLFSALYEEEDAIEMKEELIEQYAYEVFYPKRLVDITIFTPSELKTLALVQEFFQDFGARQISDFSHNEHGYKKTKNGEIISYEYSEYLQI